MCGRFALALPAAQYRAAVDDWIERRQGQGRAPPPPLPPRNGAGAAAGASGSQVPRARGRFAAGSKGAKEVQAASSSSSALQEQAEENDSSVEAVDDEAAPTPSPSLRVTPSPSLETGYHPTTNMAPTSFVPVLHLSSPTPLSSSPSSSASLTLEPMRWGLLPASTKSIPRGGDMIKTINARSDTILSGRGLWSPLFKGGKRCVVFVQGFYEWQKTPQARLPHFVGMQTPGKGRLDAQGQSKEVMPLAALWEECTLETGEKLKTFTICTTESNDELSFLHDRMPVILPTLEALETWLGVPSTSSSSSSSTPAKLLRPYEAPLACYRVPTEVGKTGTDDAKFLLPVAARKDGIEAAFGRATKRAREEDDGMQGEEKGKKVKREEVRDVGDSNAPLAGSFKTKRINASQHSSQQEEEERSAEALLQATREVEEDVEMDLAARQVEAAAERGEAEQLEADRKLAQKMQREWEREAAEASNSAASGSGAKKEENVDESDNDNEGAARLQPSSKFSPEPFNPPVSPPSKSRASNNSSSSKTEGGGGATKLEQMLETQKKKATTAPAAAAKSAPATPKKKGGGKTTEGSSASGGSASGKKKGGDIRSFFSPAS